MNNYISELYKLLSLEYNCSPSAFDSDENVITIPEIHAGRRVYSPEKYFFHMVTTGRGAVITAHECLHPFLREFINDRAGHWLFEQDNLTALERELNKFGYTLTASHHMFLSAQDAVPRGEFSVRWFFGEDILQFYGDVRLPNALCPEFQPQRPDRILVGAYDGEKLMGMAGCSEDAPHWMQIGIDVLPEYRSRGVGTYLVSLLKNKILENGDIPFYGTSLSNYHSWNIALNCGFRPAWVEIGARRKGESK